MTNPYVFIVGCQRSGTTLLKRMLNAHPQIAVTSESNWIARLFENRAGISANGVVSRELISILLENPEFKRLNIERKDLEALIATGHQTVYAEFVSGILNLFAKAQGKALVGNKTPAHVRRLHTLHALWPNARFVHLIRDGRDVCLSMAQWPAAQQKQPGTFTTWREDPVTTTAFWWELHVKLGRQARDWLEPKLYYEMRYESLVTHPVEESAALCSFLGLPYDRAMLSFHEGRTIDDPNLESKERWLPPTVGLRDWRSEMAAEEVERFEAAVGPLLDSLGYPRTFPFPSPKRLDHASRIRDLLVQDPSWISHSRQHGFSAC